MTINWIKVTHQSELPPPSRDKHGNPRSFLVWDRAHGPMVVAWVSCGLHPYSDLVGDLSAPNGGLLYIENAVAWAPITPPDFL